MFLPMKRREIWNGSVWHTPPDMPLLLRGVEHAYRDGHLDPRHDNTSSFWTLDYFFTPVRVWTPPGGWFARPPFTAHLYRGGTVYREDSRPCRTLPHHAWIQFDVADPTPLLALIDPQYGCARFADPDRVLGEQIVAVAGFAAAQGERAYGLAVTRVRELLAQLARAVPGPAGMREVPATLKAGRDALVERALAYLSEHLSEPVRVATVARALRINPHTLAHRFTRVRGEGILESLRKLRLLRGKSLLLAGHKLEAIAAQTGFCDGRHFAKVFRRHEGLSPAAYLRRLQAR